MNDLLRRILSYILKYGRRNCYKETECGIVFEIDNFFVFYEYVLNAEIPIRYINIWDNQGLVHSYDDEVLSDFNKLINSHSYDFQDVEISIDYDVYGPEFSEFFKLIINDELSYEIQNLIIYYFDNGECLDSFFGTTCLFEPGHFCFDYEKAIALLNYIPNNCSTVIGMDVINNGDFIPSSEYGNTNKSFQELIKQYYSTGDYKFILYFENEDLSFVTTNLRNLSSMDKIVSFLIEQKCNYIIEGTIISLNIQLTDFPILSSILNDCAVTIDSYSNNQSASVQIRLSNRWLLKSIMK